MPIYFLRLLTSKRSFFLTSHSKFDKIDPNLTLTGGRKYDDALSGYYQEMSKEHKDYLEQLFYKQLKASVGQRGLYEHMMIDEDRPADGCRPHHPRDKTKRK